MGIFALILGILIALKLAGVATISWLGILGIYALMILFIILLASLLAAFGYKGNSRGF